MDNIKDYRVSRKNSGIVLQKEIHSCRPDPNQSDHSELEQRVKTLEEEISESKRAKKALQKILHEAERIATEQALVIEMANAPIFGVDTDGKINEWNQMVSRITGYSKDEIMGQDLVEQYIIDDYKAQVKQVLDNALKGEETDNYELPLYTKGGKRVMILLNATTRRDVKDDIIGVIGIGQDITELSEHRENLEELVNTRTKALNKALIDTEKARDSIDGIIKSFADGLIVTDVYNRVTLMNHVAEDLLGVRFSEMIDRPIDLAIDESTLREKIINTLNKKTTGDQFDFELPSDDPSHPKIMRARTSIIYDREDKKSGIVTIIHDVTHEREVDRMKTEFLTTAAHELRTPLTSVLGFSELLLSRDNLSLEEKKEFIEYIHKESVSVTKIINELLDVGRIEAGKTVPMNKEWCIAGDAIKQLTAFFKESCPNHQFEVALPKEEHRLFVDKGKMVQVIKNIVDNAVKYSPNGGVIRIAGGLIEDNYQITIQDQGVGMNSDQVNIIFDKFSRSSVSQTSGIRGVGLGMYLVKNIVEAHKGNIWVESEPDKGTTVRFIIPMNSGEDVVYQI